VFRVFSEHGLSILIFCGFDEGSTLFAVESYHYFAVLFK